MKRLRTALAHASESSAVRAGLHCLLGCATAALHHALTMRLSSASRGAREYSCTTNVNTPRGYRDSIKRGPQR